MTTTAAAAPASAGRQPGVHLAVVLILGAIALVLAVIVAVFVVLRVTDDHSIAALPAAQQKAMDAARQETINIQTYRLKSFDSDFAAAVGGMTSDQAVQWQARKSQLKTQLTNTKQDLGATVSAAGVQSATKDTVIVLVSSDSLRIDSKGGQTTFAQNRFQVTMKLEGGRWLMSDLQSVSLS